jgi:catechol 2,3-dioxygenase-like lactoylglutathione lyase family enzyme
VAGQIATGEIHHLRLTVTDINRSREFYTSLLGFDVAVESPPPDDPSAPSPGRPNGRAGRGRVRRRLGTPPRRAVG